MDATQAVGPFGLFLLMFVVGLQLTPEDFRRVAATPRSVIGGTLGQLALLPLMTWVVVWLLGVPPVFGAGAILVAAAPGAGISNIMVALAGANTALSVSLTGMASVLSVVTLPAMAAIGMRVFLGESSDVSVDVGALFLQLLLSLLLPIGLGMWVRVRWPEVAARHARSVQRLALIVIVGMVALGVAFSDREPIDIEGVERGLAAAVVWTLAAMAIGWGVATLLRLPTADRFTYLIEFSARNIAVAAIVALSGLGRLDLTFFSGVYMAVGYPLAFVAVVVRRRLAPSGISRSEVEV